jgi:hypothetical protein
VLMKTPELCASWISDHEYCLVRQGFENLDILPNIPGRLVPWQDIEQERRANRAVSARVQVERAAEGEQSGGGWPLCGHYRKGVIWARKCLPAMQQHCSIPVGLLLAAALLQAARPHPSAGRHLQSQKESHQCCSHSIMWLV